MAAGLTSEGIVQSHWTAAPAPPTARELLVRAKQVAQLYEQIPTTVSGSVLAALVLAFALWGKVDAIAIAGWLSAIALFQSWRLIEYRRYRQAAPRPEAMPAWGKEYAIGAGVSGIIWGSAGLVLALESYESYEALTYLVLFAMGTASVSVISSYAPAFLAYVIPTMLPAIVVTACRGNPADLATAAVGFLFLLVTLGFGRNLNKRFAEAFHRGYENADLVRELTAQKGAAETAREQAEEANRQKSRVVEELIVQKAEAERVRRDAERADEQKSRLVEQLIEQKAAADKARLDAEEANRQKSRLVDELLVQKLAAERARTAAEHAAESRARFLAAASHDLRQPLHALGLLVGALIEKICYPEVRRIVESMDSSVRALDELFNALLDISKLDAGVVHAKLSAFPVQTILDRLKADFGPGAGERELRFTVRSCACAVYSDSILLQRILRNLVSNALRHTTRGGVVVGCRARGDELRIEVWDTGPGIPDPERDKIFDEFYQLENPERDRTKGLGLGLAIVRRLVSLLGYRLELKSRVGRGSVFSIAVPLSHATLAFDEDSPPVPKRLSSLEGRRIVVVDDEGAVRDSMEVLLSQWGCEVITAASGQEAVERTNLDAVPDLIIADYRLRENATGTEAIEELHRKFGRNIPALLITGDTGPERLREAQSSGYRLLHKPVSPGRLRSAIHFVVRQEAPISHEHA